MVARAVRLFPEAEDEVQVQELWYSRRSERVAQAFLLELDHALERISEAAEAYPLYRRGTRRFVMQRFPYSVVYRIEGSVIQRHDLQ